MSIIVRVLLSALLVGGAFGMSSPALASGHNCADYSTSAEATKAMGAGDPNNLDDDGDGIACESLPPGDTSSSDSDDDTTAVPSGGVDAGLGGTAADGSTIPLAATVAGSMLLLCALIVLRRRATQ